MKNFICVLIALAVFLQACSTPAPEETVNATLTQKSITPVSSEGRSTIVDGAVLQARRRAIQKAIDQSASQSGMRRSETILIGNSKVVDEWQQDNVYHVQVLTVLSKAEFCNPSYRKRIVATAFPIVFAGQISGNESQDIFGGIPREINNLLMESGDFIGVDKTATVLYPQPDKAPEIQQVDDYFGSSVINVARQTQAQFVLSGVIRDFAVESGEYIRGAGVVAQIKSTFRDVIARRGITIDVYVHDGFNGALLFQQRYSDSILGDVWIPNGYSVGGERFKATPAGNKITAIIQMASQDIRRIFTCYPFAARVSKVNSDNIVITAGAQDKVRQGDSFVVYAAEQATYGTGIPGSHKRPIGMLRIDNVDVGLSSGRLEMPAAIRKVRVGDWVKSW